MKNENRDYLQLIASYLNKETRMWKGKKIISILGWLCGVWDTYIVHWTNWEGDPKQKYVQRKMAVLDKKKYYFIK